jgi:hypothetical protein
MIARPTDLAARSAVTTPSGRRIVSTTRGWPSGTGTASSSAGVEDSDDLQRTACGYTGGHQELQGEGRAVYAAALLWTSSSSERGRGPRPGRWTERRRVQRFARLAMELHQQGSEPGPCFPQLFVCLGGCHALELTLPGGARSLALLPELRCRLPRWRWPRPARPRSAATSSRSPFRSINRGSARHRQLKPLSSRSGDSAYPTPACNREIVAWLTL